VIVSILKALFFPPAFTPGYFIYLVVGDFSLGLGSFNCWMGQIF